MIKKKINELNNKIYEKEQELNEINNEIYQKEQELNEINSVISQNKDIIKSLKTEIKELKNFINSNFDEELKIFNYKIDITNCYVISLNSKKYITIRNLEKTTSNWFTLATGYICYENYTYYDVLNLNDEKLKYIYGYTYYHPDRYCGSYCTGYSNNPPEYEEHILKVCPELIKFSDNKVPDTYLKKVYYEINNLGNKKLYKK